METASTSARKLPTTAVLISAIAIVLLALGWFYLSRPATRNPPDGEASVEAKSYLKNLQLSGVKIQATENFMNQQVVEIEGRIANNGSRKLASIDVYCLFSGLDGKQLYRERLTIARGLAANETRSFRLPFDTLPEGWNQAMPRMVIARISFAS